ncbi:MAG TPA: hypothetical protein VGN81_33565 [Pseudonocardiaceae bacterium]|jgi:hypothetical protein
MVSVQPVRGRRMVNRFLGMAPPLYADDPNWIAPLPSTARAFMSPRHNPYFAEAEIDHFVALDSGRVVGRISTTIDPGYIARYGDVGFFGWFESIDDPEVATALVETARNWVGERGMTKLAGPYSYCSTQEFGLLVDGFDTVPAAFQPHNPRYYPKLLAATGLRESFHTSTFRWTRASDEAEMTAVRKRGEVAVQAGGFTVRTMDPARWDAEMDVAYRLFAASFADNHDVIPMSRPVFDYQARELKGFLDPRLITFVLRDGEPVGFSLLMADANELLAAAGGRLSPSFLLRYRQLRRAVRGAVVLMIGASPELAGAGIGRVLAGEIAKVGLGEAGPYDTVHTTWIHEQNWQSRALVNRTRSRPYRRYAVLEKEIDR